ncbi:MAG: hypothetical protein FWE14_11205 [Lachnospiraceae bacterium]|nr:hypothetical protein [Lachnospiraceae bacterium]
MNKLLILLILTLTLTGCNNFLEVTPEQHAQIVEYSAGLLLKYDRFYESNLTAITLLAPKPEVIEKPEVGPEPDEEGLENGGRPEIIDNTVPDMPRDLTELIGVNGLEFRYSGVLVTNRYPEEVVPGESYFGIDASPGLNLLVVKFDVINISSEDIFLNMNEYDLRVGIGYNGGSFSSVLYTMLLYDLAFFKDVIPAGGTVELSSLREADIADSGEIHSVELFIRSHKGDFSFNF